MSKFVKDDAHKHEVERLHAMRVTILNELARSTTSRERKILMAGLEAADRAISLLLN